MIKKILISAYIIFSLNQVFAQRELESWRDYLSYSNAFKITLADNKIYCATTGGIMYYDLEDNSVNKLSEFVELTDFGIKTIAYGKENKVLIIAYNNCNIDLIYGSQVINVSDIKRKQISGDKLINNISIIGREAYFACGFGIVVMNLDKMEIKDTYYIGEGGSALNVNDVAADDNYFYAATNNGILRADKSAVNLRDFHNWSLIVNIPNADKKFNHVEYFAGKILANYTPDEWYGDKIYTFNGTIWESQLPIGYVSDMQANDTYLAIASRDKIHIVDNNHQIVHEISSYKFPDEIFSEIKPMSAAINANGTVWIADDTKSLVKITGNNAEAGTMIGPQNNTVFSMNYSSSGLWVTPGGTSGFQYPSFQRYNDNQWTNFNRFNHQELNADDDFRNILEVAVDPNDENHFFVASWGGGLLEYINDEFKKRYTSHNSPLESALPQSPDEPYDRIGGLAFDSKGNLWMTNSEAIHNFHKLSPGEDWESYKLPSTTDKSAILNLIVTQNDDKWIIAKRNGIRVVNSDASEMKHLNVVSYFNNGIDEKKVPMNDIHSIAEDNEGAIWIGTTVGVAVYTLPRRVWNSETLYAIHPSLDLNDGYYHPLLETETVTAIAVDGANRKWLGTQSSGVYLVSEDGDQEILHFTAENSPLLSNAITSIAINQNNGEVFFGTSEGLISYMGEATGGKNSYADVYVYPNPVRETYDGPVTVTGLKENTDVKITDVSGNLVFKTKSLGGQAVWDGRNLNGNRVKTGVYLVMCNDELGEETHISKILFIH